MCSDKKMPPDVAFRNWVSFAEGFFLPARTEGSQIIRHGHWIKWWSRPETNYSIENGGRQYQSSSSLSLLITIIIVFYANDENRSVLRSNENKKWKQKRNEIRRPEFYPSFIFIWLEVLNSFISFRHRPPLKHCRLTELNWVLIGWSYGHQDFFTDLNGIFFLHFA